MGIVLRVIALFASAFAIYVLPFLFVGGLLYVSFGMVSSCAAEQCPEGVARCIGEAAQSTVNEFEEGRAAASEDPEPAPEPLDAGVEDAGDAG